MAQDYGNRPGDGPLRRNGTPAKTPAAGPLRDADLPSKLSKAAEQMEPAVTLMRDTWDGTARIRQKTTQYLPKAPGEDNQSYADRLGRSVFFNATRQTVEGLTGFVFRKDPVLGDDVPEPIKTHWENIDNAGTHGDVFLREGFQDALTTGHAAILVEFPRTEGRQNAGQEMRGEARPYWVPIKKESILSWRTTVEDGRTFLTQLVLRECVMVADGDFGEREQVRYRVLYRERVGDGVGVVVGFRVLEITKDKTVIEVDAGTYPTQDEIPVAEVPTAGRKGMFESDPPLLDLAYLNILHYQHQSDYFTNMHLTNVPVPVTIGLPEEQGELVVGPAAGLNLPMGGDFKYVAAPADALGASKQAADDLKGDMATLGLAMLAQEKRAAETAEGKRIDKAASDSALAVSARALQDGAERALGFHAKYLRLETGGSVKVNRDFENLTLTPAQIQALSGLVRDGQLTIETLWKMLKDGNVLPEDFDDESEKMELEAEAELKRQTALEIAANTPAQPNPFDKAA